MYSEPFPFVTRAEWGARSPRRPLSKLGALHLTVHYNGPAMRLKPDVEVEKRRVKGIQDFHMGSSRKWNDIAYSFLIGNTGTVYEGRGVGHRTAANGTNTGNSNSLAVMLLIGQNEPVPEPMLNSLRCLIGTLGESGCKLHFDWKRTECPGGVVSKLRDAGKLSGKGPKHLAYLNSVVKLQTFLKGHGYDVTVDGVDGSETETALKQFQQKHGLTADGIMGPKTASKLYTSTPVPVVTPTPSEQANSSYLNAAVTVVDTADLVTGGQVLKAIVDDIASPSSKYDPDSAVSNVIYDLCDPSLLVASAYASILKREADDDGLKYWVELLKSERLTVKQFLTELSVSEEAKKLKV